VGKHWEKTRTENPWVDQAASLREDYLNQVRRDYLSQAITAQHP
jgi:hypothetical protein